MLGISRLEAMTNTLGLFMGTIVTKLNMHITVDNELDKTLTKKQYIIQSTMSNIFVFTFQGFKVKPFNASS